MASEEPQDRYPKRKLKNFAQLLLTKRYWWIHLGIVIGISVVGLLALCSWTYVGCPPLVDFVSNRGNVVIPAAQVTRGKVIFHLRGLMSWGSFWGDGAERGPDFTADALHRTVLAMRKYYEDEVATQRAVTQADRDAISVRVRREIHANGYLSSQGVIQLNEAQVYAWTRLQEHYQHVFTDPDYPEKFGREQYITDPDDIKSLSAFFFWGGWVCGADRPGESYSYTHNWPYDPDAGNHPTSDTLMWSVMSILALFGGTMLVLYVYGQMKTLPGDPFNNKGLTLTTFELEKGGEMVRPTQRSTYGFFAFAVVLFVVQVLAGVLSAEHFVGGGPGTAVVQLFGLSIPFTVIRSWHTILQIYWFFMCWVGYTIFFLPRLSRVPPGQQFLINLLLGISVLVGGGVLFGIYFGMSGYLKNDSLSYWFGAQGWEFVELGRFWHILMLAGFLLWILIIFRGVRPWITKQNLWSVPAWLFYGSGIMVLFLFFGLGATPEENFALSDYWRWMTVHMWVEVTFEVFTTCIVGYLLVQMGLLNRASAERVIFLAVMLFLVTAVVGISHNFYWIGKPTGIIALGSVFSTLQVLPLLLITLDAWRLRMERVRARRSQADGKQKFVMDGVWSYILAVNFWNIVGAGVFGSLINLPIVNYYEHSTYLTGNHAHAAMFGVKGNVALAGLLFCCQHLFPRRLWNERLISVSFWSMQIGTVMMMTLDLFPAGVYQLMAVFEHGLWYARTQSFLAGPVWQGLTWMRSLGGSLFLFGGVLPLTWFVLSRGRTLVPEGDFAEGEWTAYDTEWARDEDQLVKAIES